MYGHVTYGHMPARLRRSGSSKSLRLRSSTRSFNLRVNHRATALWRPHDKDTDTYEEPRRPGKRR